MKTMYVLLFSCFLCLQVQAQDAELEKARKNIVKLNLPALALKNISLQYEHAIARKITVAGTFRYMPEGSVPFANTIKKQANDPEVNKQLDGTTVGNFAIMPEIRFYLGRKGAFRGFYVAPFASFAQYKARVNFSYDDSAQTKYVPIAGQVNTITGGLMLGAQFRLSKSVYLDWWILGPNYGASNGTATGTTKLTPDEQQSVRDELANVDLPLTDFTYSVNDNGVKIDFKGPWAGVRGGLCIGIRF